MTFIKGMPRPAGAGRKKGVKPTMKSLRVSLGLPGFDLGAELLTICRSAETSIDLRLQILKIIAQYTQTPPKEEHHDEDTETPDLRSIPSEDLAKDLKDGL